MIDCTLCKLQNLICQLLAAAGADAAAAADDDDVNTMYSSI